MTDAPSRTTGLLASRVTAVGSLVIVGASLAGLRAAEAARRSGYRGRITLLGAEDRVPYDRPQLSKAVLDPGTDLGTPPVVHGIHPERHLRDELGVELRLGAPATGLDVEGHRVHVGAERIGYDRLIIATGAAARTLPGVPPLRGVHCLRTAADALAVRAALDAGARTVVIGAGFIGSEVASAARGRGLPVTVLEAAPLPLTRSVGVAAAEVLAGLHRAAGTDLRLSTQVAEVTSEQGVATGVRLGDGSHVPGEQIVVGVGASPATGWLEGSGVPLHEHDRGVLADATLWTGVPDIWAAGDVVHAPNALFDDDLMRTEHWTNAAEQGAAAARHALSPQAVTPLCPVPYFWSDWYGRRIQFVGTSRADEVHVVDAGSGSGPGVGRGFCALYRRGGRVVAALTVDRPRDIMKYRRQIADRATWDDALAMNRTLIPAG